MKIQDLPIPAEVKDILLEEGIDTLYPPQEQAVRAGVLEGENLVMATPTASGKTLIAEISMTSKILREGCMAFYLTPLKALAYEKYEEFKKFEKIGIKVAITTGDFDSSDPWLSEYDIIVATYEKADSLTRHKPEWLDHVKVVVLDEVHLLQDGKRGPVLEMTAAKLIKNRPQIVALSATIGNAREIAEWLNAKLVTSTWRPVPLKEGVCYNGVVYFNDGSELKIPSRGDDLSSLVFDCLDSGGQVLVFTSTRNNTIRLARKLKKISSRVLTSVLRKELRKISEEIARTPPQTKLNKELASLIADGCAFHHAGLSYNLRRIIEKRFRDNLIKVLCATTTLAAGVNLPARRVIIHDYRRYDPSVGYVPIPVLEYKQMAGRAGRPKYDKLGEAILISRTLDERDFLLQEYVFASPEKLYSKLSSQKNLRVHTLALIASGYASSVNELEENFSYTLCFRQIGGRLLLEGVRKALEFLIDNNMLEVHDSALRATPLGKRISDLYIDPLTALILLKYLKSEKELSSYEYLLIISLTPDMQKLYLRRGEKRIIEAMLEELAPTISRVLMKEIAFDEYEYEFALASAKTALLLLDWIEEVPEDTIVEKFDIGPGDLYSIVQTAEWICYASSEVCKITGNHVHLRNLLELRKRVRHGVKKELLELVKIKGIGRVRARILYNHGYKTLDDLKQATLKELTRVPLIGSELAKKMLAYVKGEATELEETSEVTPEPKVETLDKYF
ncbi:MAG TPA: DEAD/DEAH box helicase [Thermoprotei archaeon]|nr:DEAD/DEAH box helicase [Thermoprotei archaeon]